MTNLDSILKSRDMTLTTKVCLVKAMVLPVVMYGCESWTIKKSECRRIDAFELWCWRRLLRIPWTARRSSQSILKKISPECSLERLMKLTLQYFGHLTWRTTHLKRPWCWERLNAGGEGDNRGWDGWMASLTQWRWDGGTGRPGVLWSMTSWRVGHDWATELNWSDTKKYAYREKTVTIKESEGNSKKRRTVKVSLGMPQGSNRIRGSRLATSATRGMSHATRTFNTESSTSP